MIRGLLFFVCLLSLCASAEVSYVQSIENWHQKRIADLTREDGWLSLVGLFWLEPGANTFGTDPSNMLVFPKGKPFMGTYFVENGAVRLNDTPLDLTEPEGQTKLSEGTLSWYLIQRNGQFGLRLKDSASPTRTGFRGIERYPVDERWRFQGAFEKAPRTMKMPNVLGVDTDEPSPGLLSFQHAGQTYKLEPVLEDGRYFVVFADASNGQGSYAGGRFLYVDPQDLVIDFNKAYNPPCSFTHFATCPRPPDQNRLPFAVEAGEKAYKL